MSGANVNIDQISVVVNDTIPPDNYATVDAGTKVGTVYKKEQDNVWRKEVESTVQSGIKGVAKPNTAYDPITNPYPTPWAVGDSDLYEKYDVNLPGVYMDFRDLNDEDIIVSSNDVDFNDVQIWVKNGVATKILKAMPQATQSIVPFSTSTFPLVSPTAPAAMIQRTYDGSIWELKAGETALITDIPYEGSPIWNKIGLAKYDILKSTSSAYDNLIDINKLVPDTYIRQDTGTREVGAGFSSTLPIKVLPLKRYLIPGLYKQFAFYDKDGEFIPDNQSATAQDFDGTISIVPPLDTDYIQMTLINANINDYYLKLNQSLSPLRPAKTLYVSKEGGDFNRITDALIYADSTGVRNTLMIDSGVWAEKLELITPIPHSLIGISKESTIITNRLDDLYEPLKVGGGWYFENIQVVNQGAGYAVHADYAGEGITEFNNCKLKTFKGSAIGAGSHQNQTLRLKNCELKNTGDAIGTGLLYWHNNVANGVTGQKLEVINCYIDSFQDQALRLDDANMIAGGTGNEASVMFFSNSFFSGAWGVGNNNCDFRPFNAASPGMLVGQSIKLDPRSFGNNIPRINY